jgi:hypothetical protein
MNSQQAIPLLIASALLYVLSVAKAALPSSEIDRLTQTVLKQFLDNDDMQRFSETREKAFQEAATAGAYEVFEAALNSTRVGVRYAALINLRTANVPREKKRTMILGAVLNPSLWMDPDSPLGGLTMDKQVSLGIAAFQREFAQSVSEFFETTVDRDSIQALWKPENRIALARRLGGSAVVPALGNPEDSVSIRPFKSGGASASPRERSTPRPLSTEAEAGNIGTCPGGWALWAGIAAVLAAAVGWLLLRMKAGGRGE